jgi:DHA2 family multidrug resistance protein
LIAGAGLGLFVGALLFSTSALLPTLMQNILGYWALQSGYASMPRGVGSLIAFLVVPFMIQHGGPRRVLLLGIGLSMLALWWMAHFSLDMTSTPIMTAGLVQGLGTGLLFAPLNTLSYVTLNP